MKKIRLDEYLVLNGFFKDEKEAQAHIMAGNVLVNDQKIDKSGTLISNQGHIRLLNQKGKYVSRGGDKLESVLSTLPIELKGRVGIDVGISTGGFTDYLIQNGIKRVFGIDVGYGITDHKIRSHPACVLLERMNARMLSKPDLLASAKKHSTPLDEVDNIDLLVMDVSFISVLTLLPVIQGLCQKHCDFLVMVKPQFEANIDEIDKGGVIQSEEKRAVIVERVLTKLLDSGFVLVEKRESLVFGTKGNKEVFFWLKNRS